MEEHRHSSFADPAKDQKTGFRPGPGRAKRHDASRACEAPGASYKSDARHRSARANPNKSVCTLYFRHDRRGRSNPCGPPRMGFRVKIPIPRGCLKV